MKEISNLIAYRPDVKVVDATLRDGGLVNNFYFTDEFVKALYLANLRAGVDYMEFGYKASTEMFDVDKFGKWKFSRDEDIRKIVGENATDLKVSVMADVGRCEKSDIIDRADSPIDMIRVATYVNTIPGAVDLIEDAKSKGYEVCCNIMAISHSLEGELRAALRSWGSPRWTCSTSWTATAPCTRSRSRASRTCIRKWRPNTARRWESMPTTTSSLPSPIPSKR